jgi:alkylation response protein AidB-like acyl-CoA dehydrogenase
MSPEEVYRFAKAEVFRCLAERYENRLFSRTLWKRMAEIGLFGLLIPRQYGGSGKGPGELISAIEAFVQGGQDLGLCLSWLDHLLIHSHVIARFGTEEQRQRFLPALVTGERIGALAASEPGTGANPVKMKATAKREDGVFRISGHKIFITNGPVADLVVVLARTGPAPGKEGISAFLVDTSSAGFRVKEEMDFGFLHTSPHGELLFQDCAVPVENLLGKLGDGHVRISRAVFGWERFMGLIALAAHFRLILDHAIRHIADQGVAQDPEIMKRVAELHVMLEGLREFSRSLACEVLDRNGLDRRLRERLLFFVRLLAQWWDLFGPLAERFTGDPPFPLGILLADARLMDVNRQLYELQTARVAEGLLGTAPHSPLATSH